MKRSDLIKEIAHRFQIPVSRAKAIVDLVFDNMTKELSDGGKIEIRGFGSFKVKNYKGYIGRNPKTGESVTVNPKRGIVFRVGRELREYLKSQRKDGAN
jgi:integration host factor subunit beta